MSREFKSSFGHPEPHDGSLDVAQRPVKNEIILAETVVRARPVEKPVAKRWWDLGTDERWAIVAAIVGALILGVTFVSPFRDAVLPTLEHAGSILLGLILLGVIGAAAGGGRR